MQFPKTAFIAALLAVVIVAAAGPAVGDEFKVNADRCWDLNAHPDLRIGACTWLLNSGRLAQKDIPSAFFRRGYAYEKKGQYDRALMDELNRSRASEASVGCPTTNCPRVLYKVRESGSTYRLEWQ